MSITILIIDDALHIRRVIARMLQYADIEILEAANGLQGLQLLREQQPALVTCDISMPVMDGYEFLTQVKQDPKLKNIPIIMITAVGQEEETSKAIELGADACLTKPFSSSHLLELIRTQLDKNNQVHNL